MCEAPAAGVVNQGGMALRAVPRSAWITNARTPHLAGNTGDGTTGRNGLILGRRDPRYRNCRIACAGSPARNTDVPATITFAPLSRASRAVSALMPPSTSMW